MARELSDYEKERIENIKRNQEHLALLGLDEQKSRLFKKKSTRSSRTVVSRGPPRRSPRLENKPPALAPLDDDDNNNNVVVVVLPAKRKRPPPKNPLTTEERARLEANLNVDDFRKFCVDSGMSADNVRQVCAQTEKLCSGAGVCYAGWPEGVVFRQNDPVSLRDDLVRLLEAARAFQLEHGRDKGNGWLLNHPISKLIKYQAHLVEGP